MNSHDEGMGLSVAIYAAALIGGLALFVAPVLWASGATVYENPGVKAARLPGGSPYAQHRAEFPLAHLRQQQIVDQKTLNELNAKTAQKSPPPHRVTRSAQRSYAQAREVDEQRPARRPFFFSFF